MKKKIIKKFLFVLYSISSFLWASACSTKKEANPEGKTNSPILQPNASMDTQSFTPPTTKYGVRPVVKYGPPPAYMDTLIKDSTSHKKDSIPPRPVTKYGVPID